MTTDLQPELPIYFAAREHYSGEPLDWDESYDLEEAESDFEVHAENLLPGERAVLREGGCNGRIIRQEYVRPACSVTYSRPDMIDTIQRCLSGYFDNWEGGQTSERAREVGEAWAERVFPHVAAWHNAGTLLVGEDDPEELNCEPGWYFTMSGEDFWEVVARCAPKTSGAGA